MKYSLKMQFELMLEKIDDNYEDGIRLISLSERNFQSL